MQNVQMAVPLLKVIVCVKDWCDDINDSEVVAFVDSNICCISIFRQHEASLATRQEVNVRYIVSLEEYVVLFGILTRLQKWADPGNEGRRTLFENINLLVCFLMNVQRHFKFQLVWQFANEVVDIILILIVVIFDNLSESFVQIERQEVVLVDSIQNRNSLLQFGWGLIVVLHNRRKGTGCEGEWNDANEHDNDWDASFECVLTCNISVSYRGNCSYSKVKRS